MMGCNTESGTEWEHSISRRMGKLHVVLSRGLRNGCGIEMGRLIIFDWFLTYDSFIFVKA